MQGTKRTWRRVASISAVGLLASLAPVAAASGQDSGPAPRSTRYDTTLSPRLAALAEQATARTTSSAEAAIVGLPADGPGALLHDASGALLVNLVLDGSHVPTDAEIAAAGGRATARSDDATLITVSAEPAALPALSALPGVMGVVEQQVPEVHGDGVDTPGLAKALQDVGATTNAVCGDRKVSEADTQLGAASARSARGVDGTGITVGVLSDSYNYLNGAATDVANGELPGPGNPCGRTTPVQVQSDYSSNSPSDEGRAMAQAVHDLAPGATIRMATAFNGDVDFANQIRALANAGADVIVDDITYFNEPMYQDGVIAKAVNDVTAQGVVYFSSAQNSNMRIGSNDVGSYEAASYRPTTCPSNIATTYGALDCHDFNPGTGVDNGNGFTVANGGYLRFLLGYSEPRYGVKTDLDLFLVDKTTNSVVAASTADNPGSTQLAYESVAYTNSSGSTRTYDVVVARYDGTGTPRFRTVSSRSGSVTATERTATSGTDVVGPTSFGHNMTPRAASIAAIPYSSNTAPETFSSRGPVNYCWGPVVGTTVAASKSCVSDTIDITATDGGANSFFGSLVSGTYRFYGTSQAAPHAAAVAALMRQARPCRTPAQIIQAQRSTGAAIGSYGVNTIGGGLLRATQAIDALAACPANLYSPFASWSAFVTRVYTDMIGAAPSSVVRDGYVSRLSNGTLSPGGFVGELRNSTDNLVNVDPATRLYSAYFLRIPDAGGLKYWIRQRRVNGKTLNRISDVFAASSEFKNKYGSLSNRAFVELVYQNVLGRAGETSGVNYWTSRLDRKVSSRGTVMTGFSESSEYTRKQTAKVNVSATYILLLGQAPGTSAFNSYVAGLESELIGTDDLASDILWSAAYAAHVG